MVWLKEVNHHVWKNLDGLWLVCHMALIHGSTDFDSADAVDPRVLTMWHGFCMLLLYHPECQRSARRDLKELILIFIQKLGPWNGLDGCNMSSIVKNLNLKKLLCCLVPHVRADIRKSWRRERPPKFSSFPFWLQHNSNWKFLRVECTAALATSKLDGSLVCVWRDGRNTDSTIWTQVHTHLFGIQIAMPPWLCAASTPGIWLKSHCWTIQDWFFLGSNPWLQSGQSWLKSSCGLAGSRSEKSILRDVPHINEQQDCLGQWLIAIVYDSIWMHMVLVIVPWVPCC